MIDLLELVLTERCNMSCPGHCYVQAGPHRGHGSMTAGEWSRLLAEAALLGASEVQLIGGEPTLHPAFIEILTAASELDLDVEVFSNLTHIREEWWPLFTQNKVRLATSYYSDRPEEHDRVTGTRGSHAKTRANILEAVRRGVSIRASIVEVLKGQRVDQAHADLRQLGVRYVKVDHKRAIGNGANGGLPSTSELCGRCGDRRVAVASDGSVGPCSIGARFLSAGNVRERPLRDILESAAWTQLLEKIPVRAGQGCNPDSDSNDCAPAGTEWEPE